MTHKDIQFNLHSNCRVDIVEFSQLLDTCQQHHQEGIFMCRNCLEHLLAAVELYRGDLLVGISLPGCSQLEWWLTCKQEEYHRQMIEILKKLVGYYELEGDYSRAVKYTQRAIELEPWSESLHRQMMRVLTRSNQRIAALRQYEICRQILAREFGVEPAIETTNLYQQILTGTLCAG